MSFFDLVKSSQDQHTELKNALTDVANDKHIPLGATFELSPLCNFRCPFCYARKTPEEMRARGEEIMRFAQWKRFIDEANALGTLELTLTGGECMLHPDFVNIYRYAYKQGLEVTMMTNGSSITKEIISAFRECPPSGLYITLYGGSPETYERVCGNARYYDLVLNNLKVLQENKIPVTLQFTAGKDNISDLKAVAKIAKEMKVKLRYARADFAFRRATPETLDSCEVSWKEFNEVSSELTMEQLQLSEEKLRSRDNMKIPFVEYPVIEKGMSCGAGKRSFFIDHLGYMHPCVSLDAIKVDTSERSLADCWEEIVQISKEIPQLVECTNCLFRTHCKQCVAAHYDDLGEFGKPSPRLCFKCQFPEKATEIEARYNRDGYLRFKDLK